MTRRRLLCALVVLAGSTGAAPRAALKMPPSVPAGGLAWFDVRGTVSDAAPVVLCLSGPGEAEKLFRGDRSFVGFALTTPGVYTFEVVASGAAPGSAATTYDVAFATVSVTGGTPTPPAPSPSPGPTPPTPSPQDDAPFTAAYRAYSGGMNAALLALADDVESGKVATKQAFLDALRAHSAPFAKAVDDLFLPNTDAAGKVTNRAAIAGPLRAAVKP